MNVRTILHSLNHEASVYSNRKFFENTIPKAVMSEKLAPAS